MNEIIKNKEIHIEMNDTVSRLTGEIRELCRQARGIALAYATQIGKRLKAAKEELPHGAWLPWLKSEVEFSERNAQNFIKLYEEYGDFQIDFFGMISNPQTFADLPYSKALALLALPLEEREEFADKAQNSSLKELEEAIKARNAAIAEADKAKKRIEKLEGAEKKRLEAEKTKSELLEKLEDLTRRYMKSTAEIVDLKKQISEVEKNPKISKAELNKLRKELTEKIEAESRSAFEEKEKELKRQILDAEDRAREASFEKDNIKLVLEDAEKQLKMANPNVLKFKTVFEDFQDKGNRLKELLNGISEKDSEISGKLFLALKSYVERILKQ